jgi:hypothetical protein
LDGGRTVLYSGTPCQVAGLYRYLGGDREGLLTCELVCAGVPSPEVFARYLSLLEKKYKGNAVSVFFRKKNDNGPRFSVTFDNGKKYERPLYSTVFGHGFGASLYLRPSCGTCSHARAERVADFTIGDFWDLLEPLPEGAHKGISLVLTNSEKAGQVELPPLFEYVERSWHEAVAGNPRLIRPPVHNPRRSQFFAVYQTRPFRRAAGFILPLHKRAGRRLKRFLRRLKP